MKAALCTASPAAGLRSLSFDRAQLQEGCLAGKGMQELPCDFIFNPKRFSYRLISTYWTVFHTAAKND